MRKASLAVISSPGRPVAVNQALLVRKKHFILDFDGTLADTTRAHAHAFQTVFAAFGVDVVYSKVAGLTTDAAIRTLAREAGIDLTETEVGGLVSQKQRLARELIPQWVQWFVGVPEFFRWAEGSGKTLSLVTSASRGTLDVSLRSLPGTPRFSPCIAGDDVSQGKPHPEGYRTVIDATGFSREDCLVFEDSEAGFRAAAEAGLDYVEVDPRTWSQIAALIQDGERLTHD